MADETVNPKQEFGDKKVPVHLVPPALLLHAAWAFKEGADKYGPYNWRDKPVQVSTYYAACMRHLQAFWDGEDVDPDSKIGKTHLAGAVASLVLLLDSLELGVAIDDRPMKGPAPGLLSNAEK